MLTQKWLITALPNMHQDNDYPWDLLDVSLNIGCISHSKFPQRTTNENICQLSGFWVWDRSSYISIDPWTMGKFTAYACIFRCNRDDRYTYPICGRVGNLKFGAVDAVNIILRMRTWIEKRLGVMARRVLRAPSTTKTHDGLWCARTTAPCAARCKHWLRQAQRHHATHQSLDCHNKRTHGADAPRGYI